MSAPATYWCELALIGDAVSPRVAIGVADGAITAIDTGVEAPAGARRLAGLTIPGLANTHSHAFHRALRHRTQAETGSFFTWRKQMYRVADRLDPDSYHRLARATFAEMALAGITVVGEFHYLHHQPGGARHDDPNAMGTALLAAAAEAGIRITLLDTLYLHGGLDANGYRPPDNAQRRFTDGSVEAWAERVDRLSPSAGQKVGAAVHSVRAVDPAAVAVVAKWATSHDAPVHAHVSEQPSENEQSEAYHRLSPSAVMHDAGLLEARFTAIHATHLSRRDIEFLGAAQANVCLCPTTERDLADGIGPSAQLREAGARLSLGSDSHAVIDLFEEARAVELDERLATNDRGTHRAADLLTMATANGHHALGWDDAGELRVGGRADLVAVSLDSVRTAGSGARHAVAATVFAATAADVTDVIVDGIVVVEDRAHTSIDAAA